MYTYCKKCRLRRDDTSSYCSHCGDKLTSFERQSNISNTYAVYQLVGCNPLNNKFLGYYSGAKEGLQEHFIKAGFGVVLFDSIDVNEIVELKEGYPPREESIIIPTKC